jgi:hypothetical protein
MALFSIPELKYEAQKLGVLSKSFYASELKKSATESSYDQRFHVFMSNSILDADVVFILKTKLENMGYSVYIDWDVDGPLDRSKVDKDTAQLIRLRMQNCSCLFFATSDNSPLSKWMPWELGYFDALKGRVAILPLSEYSPANYDLYNGQEYLGLYPYVTIGPNMENENWLWIRESLSKYIRFDYWLGGSKPQEHS